MTRWRKAKRTSGIEVVGIELSINDNTKSPQIYTLPQWVVCSGAI